MLLIAWLSLLIWIILLFGRGGFWRAQPALALSATTIHAVGNAAIARRGVWPALVAVVPARNEVQVIGRAVGSLLRQDYPGAFHVIVVDDHSTDGTAAAVAAARDFSLEDRDLVSLMVRLRCDSLWEKALIPAFVFFFAKLYPFAWVNDVKKTTSSAAGGCMLVAALGARRGRRHRIDPAGTDR